MLLDLILNERLVLGALVAAAVATPLAALLAGRRCPQWRGRLLVALGAAGPAALLFFGWHHAVLAVLGFDSVISLFVIVASALAVGVTAGMWVRRDRAAPQYTPGEPKE